MRIAQVITSIILALAILPASANPLNRMIEIHSDPNEFHLFNQIDSETVSFDSKETVEVCAGDSKQVTALKVVHDGTESSLKPGNCREFTGKQFTFSPAGVVPNNWNLTGTIKRAS